MSRKGYGMTEEEELQSAISTIREDMDRQARANELLVQGVLDSMMTLKKACDNAARVLKGEPLPH